MHYFTTCTPYIYTAHALHYATCQTMPNHSAREHNTPQNYITSCTIEIPLHCFVNIKHNAATYNDRHDARVMRRDITRHHTTRQNNTKQDTYRTHPVSPYKFHGLKGCWTRIKSIFPSLFQSTIRGRRKSVRFAVTRSKGLSSTSR